MSAAVELASEVGVAKACAAFDVARATVYRRLSARPKASRTGGARALSEAERTSVHEVLCSERFVDASPAEVHASLLDEGVHVASVSTMYRILRAKRSVRERRAVRRHPSYARPELVARAPNQVWTWDITKVRGPGRRDWYHLYVIIDLYSRYVVGWLLAAHESGALAERFIAETMSTHGVQPGELTLHSDRGVSMRSKTVAEMLADMGVVRSHSRPRTSNDNPFSEAQFKTMKYCPFFSGLIRFGRRGSSVLHAFRRLVQQRAPPQRDRHADAGSGLRRHGRSGRRRPSSRHGRVVCEAPGAVRARSTHRRAPRRGGLDQPARTTTARRQRRAAQRLR